MRLWVVVPAFNEAENLADLLPRIVDNATLIDPAAQILVVDDGSSDQTVEVTSKLTAEFPQIRCESLGRNRGKAAALQRGFDLAVEQGAEVLVMMDADGQDDPTELPRLVAQIEAGYGVATGARYSRNDRFIKRNTSKIYNRATGILSGAPGKDFNSGFKAMSASVATEVSPMLYGELHRYLTVIAHWLGYQVTEVSVQHHERMHGASKYGIARFWRGFLDLLTVRFLMSYENRPLHLFGGIGFVLFALGGVTLSYLTVTWFMGQAIGDRPLLIGGVLLVVVGLQLMLFGLLAELIVYGRNRDTR